MAVNLIDSNDIQVAQTGDNIELQIDDDIKNSISQNTSDIVDVQQDITNLENGNVYSTNEVKTNKTWIDGKPIYRKVLVINNLPNNTSTSYAHSISNIDLIYIEKAFWSLSDGACGPIPQYVASSEVTSVYVNKTNVVITANVNYSTRKGYVVLEYTKTTD